jgi:hypothetical protein
LNLRIRSPRMDIHSAGPQVHIETEDILVQIDSQDAWADLGYKRLPEWKRDIRDTAKEEVLETIKLMAQTGDMIADIHEGVKIGPLVADQAWPQPKEINVDCLPKNPLDIDFFGGQKISWIMGEVNVKLIAGEIDYYYKPGRVDIQAQVAYRSEPKVDLRI